MFTVLLAIRKIPHKPFHLQCLLEILPTRYAALLTAVPFYSDITSSAAANSSNKVEETFSGTIKYDFNGLEYTISEGKFSVVPRFAG